jgi:hypothetical protein
VLQQVAGGVDDLDQVVRDHVGAMPTAMPEVPLTSRFGIAAGSTDGC